MYMTTLRTRVRSIKEVCCLSWGRRHLKLLVIACELLNVSLQRRENWKEQNLLHQRSDIRRADYALLWMILIVMPFDVLFMSVFYAKKEYPTLDKLLQILKEKELFTGGRISLCKVLRKIGFRYKKVNDKRYVYEQPKIILQRHQYLRRMRRNRTENKPVVYLDETSHCSHERSWVESDDVGRKLKVTSRNIIKNLH